MDGHRALARQDPHALQWWVADWWAFGDHRYGERGTIVGSEDWDGPSFQTCANAASVARAFAETSRRRESLTFTHHNAVASLPPTEADRLLDWCEEMLPETGKPRSTRALQDEMCRRREIEVSIRRHYGNGAAGGDPNALYFTAGVQNESHGLFGSLTPNPAPDQTGMMGSGAHSMFG